MAVDEARRLASKRSRSVLAVALEDSDNNIRLAALDALRERAAPGSIVDLVSARLTDADPRVQQMAVATLERAAKKRPVAVYQALLEARVAPEVSRCIPPVRRAMDRVMQEIESRAGEKLAAHLLHIAVAAKDEKRRARAIERLATLRQGVASEAVLPVVDKLRAHESPEVRAAAVTLLAQHGDAEEVLPTLTELAYTVRPRGEAATMRRAAATGFGLVPGRPDKDRLKLLRRLLGDPAPIVRSAAMESLINLGPAALRETVRGIKRGPVDVAMAALRAVCDSAHPDRRVATTVLATTWKRDRSVVREEALRCARQLAAANPRLSIWLADQARLDKNPEVRRSAAEAVALAFTRGGRRAERLAEHYLRLKDASVVTAVLEALADVPPRASHAVFRQAVKLVQHPEPAVRAAAAPVIVRTAPRPSDPVKPLKQLLGDPDPQVAQAALAATEGLEPGEATGALDAPVARALTVARSREALRALRVARRLGLEQPIRRAAAHAEPEVRAAAVEALASSADTKRTLAALEAARLDPEPALRKAALEAISDQSARLGDAAVKLLTLSARSASADERWSAFDALGSVRGKSVTPAVVSLSEMARHRSEERRRLAIQALGALAPHSPDAARELIRGALDPALDVRTEAQAVLAKYLGRYCPAGVLWELLLQTERNALLRHTLLSSVAWHGRIHGTGKIQLRVEKLDGDVPLPVQMAARLALALAQRPDRSPEDVISWLYGW
jgi:HEAT repeat protein